MSFLSQSIGFFTLSQDVNKVKDPSKRETEEGVVSDFEPALSIEMDEEKMVRLAKSWEKKWKTYFTGSLKQRQDRMENYWRGKQDDLDSMVTNTTIDKPNFDNLIFEALETFLPTASSVNPQPTTLSDGTAEGFELSRKVNKMLVHQADIQTLKLKGKKALRHWSLYLVGVAKIGWDEREDDIATPIIRPQRLILDPNCTIDEKGEYQGEYIGEIKEDSAENLIERFPEHTKFITKEANGKLGTTINYTEWWTDQILFWKLKNTILGKVRNPHWNYDEEEMTEIEVVDDFGDITTKEQVKIKPGMNHFKHPRKPYVFLTIFNVGKRPHDDTTLIEQNLVQQDRITKRETQIDDNVDNMNGGWIISMSASGYTKEQAGRAARVLQKGGVLAIPTGKPGEAVQRITGTGLPGDVFTDLQDTRNELRGIFGITGLTPQGTNQDSTVRGKIITRSQDTSRIGGGITEYLEQWYDSIYNWWVQMFYVYYDEEKLVPILGPGGTQELISLINTEMDRVLLVSVKEGSLIPKDELTRRNEAIELFGAGAIDPLTLFEMIDHPNPKEAVERLAQWQSQDVAGLLGNSSAGQPAAPGGEPVPPQEETILNNIPLPQ